MSLLEKLKNHWQAFVVACCVGLLFCLPQLLIGHVVPKFQGIYKQVADDGLYYEARARDVIDGHMFLSNPYLAEHKVGQPLQVWLPDALLAWPIAALHMTIPVGFIVWTGILNVLIALLLYAVSWELTTSRSLACSVLSCSRLLYSACSSCVCLRRHLTLSSGYFYSGRSYGLPKVDRQVWPYSQVYHSVSCLISIHIIGRFL